MLSPCRGQRRREPQVDGPRRSLIGIEIIGSRGTGGGARSWAPSLNPAAGEAIRHQRPLGIGVVIRIVIGVPILPAPARDVTEGERGIDTLVE